MFKKFLKFIYPETYTCLCCGRDVFDNPYLMCQKCLNNLPFITEKVCAHCGVPLNNEGNYCKICKGKNFVVDRAVSPFVYQNEIKKLIKDLKYNNAKYTSISLGKFMADHYAKTKLFADLIIPVPLCSKRFKERGYNQSKLLADILGTHINVPVVDNVLIRVKETPTQTKLNFVSRRQNMTNAFEIVNKNEVKDKVVLLVDDIYTTGATAYECAKTLKSAGAKSVYVITVAHTILKEQGEDNEEYS